MNCETQETIVAWAEKTFGETNPQAAFKRCAMEFAELAEAMGYDGLAKVIKLGLQYEPGRPPLRVPAAKECADVAITLYRVASTLESHLHDAIDDKMVINRGRKWKITGDGVGVHVKDQ